MIEYQLSKQMRWILVLIFEVVSLCLVGLGAAMLFLGFTHPEKPTVDIDMLEAGGSVAFLGLFAASIMLYFWPGKVSDNGVSPLPIGLALLPMWPGLLLLAGLLIAEYENAPGGTAL
jgi:hypothetical protein